MGNRGNRVRTRNAKKLEAKRAASEHSEVANDNISISSGECTYSNNSTYRHKMKRIKLLCGICKRSKCYTTNRKPYLIGLIISCENCKLFYQKIKTSDVLEPCSNNNWCFKKGSFMDLRCKCCFILQVIDIAILPAPQFDKLISMVPSESLPFLKNGKRRNIGEPDAQSQGSIHVEVYSDGKWIIKEELTKAVFDTLSTLKDAEQTSQHVESLSAWETTKTVVVGTSESAKRVQTKSTVNVKTSDRIRNKRKAKFSKNSTGPKGGPAQMHGPVGKLLSNGVDLCDCLQKKCPGCHFPCPKCRSPKCGHECRVNRKSYYEKTYVEGTSFVFKHPFAP